MAAALGVRAKFGLGATSTVDEAFDFLSCDVALRENFVDTAGLTGSRSHPSERVREGTRQVEGPFRLNPDPVGLARLLPRILGAAAISTTFGLAETLPAFYLAVDQTIKVPVFNTCYANRGTFRGTVGQPLELTVDVIGTSETVGNSGTFPSISLDLTTKPFMFHDLAVTVNGVSYSVKEFELVVDNALEVEHFNSATPTRINATDRIVTCNLMIPYGDASAAYNLGAAGVAVVATFTNGAVSMAATMPKVAFPRISPVVNARGEIMLSLQGTARKSGSTNELEIVLDSTP